MNRFVMVTRPDCVVQ